MTFEQAYDKLNQIATSLSSADISLDEALKLFEEAVKVSKVCLEKLQQTSAKIEVFKGELEKLKPLTVV